MLKKNADSTKYNTFGDFCKIELFLWLVHHQIVYEPLHFGSIPVSHQACMVARFPGPAVITAFLHNDPARIQLKKWLGPFYSGQHGSLIPTHSSGAVFLSKRNGDRENIFYRTAFNFIILDQRNAGLNFLPDLKSTQ